MSRKGKTDPPLSASAWLPVLGEQVKVRSALDPNCQENGTVPHLRWILTLATIHPTV